MLIQNTILFQIINLSLTICFLRKYLFTFLLEHLREVEALSSQLQATELLVNSKISVAMQQQKDSRWTLRARLANDLSAVSALREKPTLDQVFNVASLKNISESQSQDKLNLEQISEPLFKIVQLWAQK